MQLEMRDVGHRFGAQPWLFRHVTATLCGGKTYALVGPSGSGKSTMLGILAGWTMPDEGFADRGGTTVAWVFQNPTAPPRRTALDIVAYPFLAMGSTVKESQTRATRTMRMLGIEHLADHPFGSCSGGEAQRVMLARAVATGSDLLLIDEPTAQLDRTTASRVNECISSISAEKTIVVVATHDAATRDACSDVLDLSAWSCPSSTEEP